MIAFEVNDMTCGHCVSTITKALMAVDPSAELRFDLAVHRVEIESGDGEAEAFRQAIEASGYSPVSAKRPATRTPAPTGGCCCRR